MQVALSIDQLANDTILKLKDEDDYIVNINFDRTAHGIPFAVL